MQINKTPIFKTSTAEESPNEPLKKAKAVEVETPLEPLADTLGNADNSQPMYRDMFDILSGNRYAGATADLPEDFQITEDGTLVTNDEAPRKLDLQSILLEKPEIKNNLRSLQRLDELYKIEIDNLKTEKESLQEELKSASPERADEIKSRLDAIEKDVIRFKSYRETLATWGKVNKETKQLEESLAYDAYLKGDPRLADINSDGKIGDKYTVLVGTDESYTFGDADGNLLTNPPLPSDYKWAISQNGLELTTQEKVLEETTSDADGKNFDAYLKITHPESGDFGSGPIRNVTNFSVGDVLYVKVDEKGEPIFNDDGNYIPKEFTKDENGNPIMLPPTPEESHLYKAIQIAKVTGESFQVQSVNGTAIDQESTPGFHQGLTFKDQEGNVVAKFLIVGNSTQAPNQGTAKVGNTNYFFASTRPIHLNGGDGSENGKFDRHFSISVDLSEMRNTGRVLLANPGDVKSMKQFYELLGIKTNDSGEPIIPKGSEEAFRYNIGQPFLDYYPETKDIEKESTFGARYISDPIGKDRNGNPIYNDERTLVTGQVVTGLKGIIKTGNANSLVVIPDFDQSTEWMHGDNRPQLDSPDSYNRVVGDGAILSVFAGKGHLATEESTFVYKNSDAEDEEIDLAMLKGETVQGVIINNSPSANIRIYNPYDGREEDIDVNAKKGEDLGGGDDGDFYYTPHNVNAQYYNPHDSEIQNGAGPEGNVPRNKWTSDAAILERGVDIETLIMNESIRKTMKYDLEADQYDPYENKIFAANADFLNAAFGPDGLGSLANTGGTSDAEVADQVANAGGTEGETE